MNSLIRHTTLFGMLALAACTEETSSTPETIQPEPESSAMAVDNPIEQVASAYTRLVLSLGQHDADYVDAYYGPPEWAEQAQQNILSTAAIAEQAGALRASLNAAPQPEDGMLRLRRHYLDRQLLAVASHARTLGSGSSSFDEQTQTLYDTEVPPRALASFEPVLAELEALVPGTGDLRERVETYRAGFAIPTDRLQAVFDRAIAECRARSAEHIELPANENFTMEFVTDQPWSGYNWYKGNAYSLIQINTDLPIDISRAVDLGCHEGYPGHHAYNVLLEQNLVQQRGWTEFSVYPLFSPQSLIAEGSANYGIELAFPGNQKMAFERDVLYPLAGLDPDRAAAYDHFLGLLDELSYAGNEVARQYIDGDIDAEQAAALLQQYALNSEAASHQRVRFFDAYGAYVINYNWGEELVRRYIEQTDDQDGRWRRFRTLISSPRVPSSLEM